MEAAVVADLGVSGASRGPASTHSLGCPGRLHPPSQAGGGGLG